MSSRRFPRLALVAIVALSCVGVATAGAATRGPATLTLTGVDPATSDAGAYNFTIGFAGADDPAAGFVKGAKTGHCIENGIQEANTPSAVLRTGTQGSDLSLIVGSPAAAAGGRDRLQWLLLSSARSRVTTTGTQRNFEAAAHQLAIWLLTSAPGGPAVTATDAAALTRAQALVAQSTTYAPAVAAAPALTPLGAEVCGQTTRAIRVTGAPLTNATITVAGGTATLTGGTPTANGQSTTVTLGADGTAEVVVNSTAIGAVRLTGTFTTHTMVQVDAGTNQDFAYLEPRSATAEATMNFTACTTPPTPRTPPTPPTTPAPPVVISGNGTTTLAITKVAPPSVRAGNTINYTIRVRNTTNVAATNVTVTDILPSGTVVVSRSSNARVTGSRVIWTIPTLGAKASRTLTLALRVKDNVRKPRCNAAMTRADNAPMVMARVCTAVVAGARFQPIVTG